jgi:hypothetical protein
MKNHPPGDRKQKNPLNNYRMVDFYLPEVMQ